MQGAKVYALEDTVHTLGAWHKSCIVYVDKVLATTGACYCPLPLLASIFTVHIMLLQCLIAPNNVLPFAA